MKYTVIINETRRIAIERDAISKASAIEKIIDDYCEGKIVSNEDDIATVELNLEEI